MIYFVEVIQPGEAVSPIARMTTRGGDVMRLVEALRRDYPEYVRIEVYADETPLFVIDGAGRQVNAA